MALPPITDLLSLKAAVSDYLTRTDLEYAYDAWIQNAEGRLSSVLKVPDMEKAASLTLDADGTVAVPADYIEWIMVRWQAAGGAGARKQRLRYVEANSPEFTYRHRPNGDAQFYTVVGGEVQIVPPRAGAVDLTYYARIPPLTNANPTNWLLAKSPQIYLYAVLAESYVFQKDEARASEWLKATDERLKLLISESGSAKVGRRAERAAEEAAEVRAANAPT